MNGLRGNPHDQQHCGCIGLPEALVGDVDPRRPHLRRPLVQARRIEPMELLCHSYCSFLNSRPETSGAVRPEFARGLLVTPTLFSLMLLGFRINNLVFCSMIEAL